MPFNRKFRLASLFTVAVMGFSMLAVDYADARRAGGGGGFGSRGARTYQSAPATSTAPTPAAPVQRSMTPNSPSANSTAGAAAQRGGGMFGGFGRSMLGGLALGGLFGMLMGSGFGGMGGMLSLLFQVLLIGGVIMLAMRFFRRSSPAGATAGAAPRMNNAPGMSGANANSTAYEAQKPNLRSVPGIGAALGGGNAARGGGARRTGNPDELGITGDDLSTFERMLGEIQGAYGREDYAALRRLSTPEMVSYFSEELGQNASSGLKNEVSDVRLLQGDVAESWREGNREYATVDMRYSSIDATVERATGRVVQGDNTQATESTETWTFTRERGGNWLLSAIQDA